MVQIKNIYICHLAVKVFRNEIRVKTGKICHYSEDIEINKHKSENVEIFKYPDPLMINTIVVCAVIKARIVTGNKTLRCTGQCTEHSH
jgi:hypothetical protein